MEAYKTIAPNYIDKKVDYFMLKTTPKCEEYGWKYCVEKVINFEGNITRERWWCMGLDMVEDGHKYFSKFKSNKK